MNKYLWASPHNPTEAQLKELSVLNGKVVLLKDINPDLFGRLSNLQFDTDLDKLAGELLSFAMANCDFLVQPAGSPAFHMRLGITNVNSGMEMPILFAFSKRVSKDVENPDGSVTKTVVFNHEGFI